MKLLSAFAAFLMSFLMAQTPVFACAVCFGDPDSTTTKSVLLGVTFLLGLISAVLGAILYLIWTYYRRAKAFSATSAAH